MGFQSHWELCQRAPLPAVLHSLHRLACAVPWWPCQGFLGRRHKLVDVNNKGGSSGHDQLRDMADGARHGVELQGSGASGFAFPQTLNLVLLGDKTVYFNIVIISFAVVLTIFLGTFFSEVMHKVSFQFF